MKLSAYKASPASKMPMTALREASEKPRRRPKRCISMVAGTVVAAMHKTMTEIGNVAKAGSTESFAPMMPPSATMMKAPVAEINWQLIRIKMFRSGIGDPRLQSSAFSHILKPEPTHVDN